MTASIGAQAVERAATTFMDAYSAAGPSAQGACIANMVASYVSTIRTAAESSVAEAAQVSSRSKRTVEKFNEPTPAHVVAFENFIRGYEPTHRLYHAFYGVEDSDDPELEQARGSARPRGGANPFPMPAPFSHEANKAVLARYGIELNHYKDGAPRKRRG